MPDNYRRKRSVPRRPFRVRVRGAAGEYVFRPVSVRQTRAVRAWRKQRRDDGSAVLLTPGE